jgi:hypothetical protein
MRIRSLRPAAAAAALTLLAACSGEEPTVPTTAPVPSPTTMSGPPFPGPASPATASAATEPTGTVITAEQLHAMGWRSIQAPSSENVRYVDDTAALGGGGGPAGPVLRFDLAPGELYEPQGQATSRAEVYGRVSTSWSDPTASWPDPPGSERWFTFALYVPGDFQPATDPAMWLDLTQWKGRDGGSPPVAVEVLGSHLRLGGTRANAGALPGDGDLGPLTPGAWTTLTVGIRFSAADDGWVEVLRDGREALPRTQVSTMDTIDGEIDPMYLKQGIYRSKLWSTIQTFYLSPVTVTEERPAGLP